MATGAVRYAPTAARSFDAVTLATAKLHCRIEFNDDDTLVTAYIAAATDYVERMANRSLALRAWTVQYGEFPRNGRQLTIPVAPLVSVTSLQYTTPSGSVVTAAAGDYRVSTFGIGAVRPSLARQSWWDTAQVEDAVVVSATIGYAAQADIPKALQQAVLLLVGHYYEHREAVSSDSGSEVEMAVAALVSSFKLPDLAT